MSDNNDESLTPAFIIEIILKCKTMQPGFKNNCHGYTEKKHRLKSVNPWLKIANARTSV